jgi:hypothetical protein
MTGQLVAVTIADATPATPPCHTVDGDDEQHDSDCAWRPYTGPLPHGDDVCGGVTQSCECAPRAPTMCRTCTQFYILCMFARKYPCKST